MNVIVSGVRIPTKVHPIRWHRKQGHRNPQLEYGPSGSLAERFKALVLKTSEGLSPP